MNTSSLSSLKICRIRSMYSYSTPLKVSISNPVGRVSSRSSTTAIERTYEGASRSFAASSVLTAQNVFDRLQSQLEHLVSTPTDWNSYGSPSPDPLSIKRAQPILNALRSKVLQPDKLLPSADGGVSFIFVSDTQSRATVESLNNGERYVLLYDLSGNSRTIDWPDEGFEQDLTLIDSLRTHLRSKGLAATR